MPYAPRWTGSASLGYSHALNADYDITAEASVDFRSKIALAIESNTIVPPSVAYAKANVRVALDDRKSGVEIAIVGRNLNNERTTTFGFQAFPNVPGAYVLATDEPRTLALQISIRR
jgi:hypothetical protein